MQIALDYNNNRVHISQTYSNQEYYCPTCGAPLITKKGEERIHHFAHKSGHACKDTWERTHKYDISPWHNEWQNMFPKENLEIPLKLGDICHRADVLVDRTVIELQHSVLSAKAFEERNNFYRNLGYKVVWLFDMSDLFKSGEINCEKTYSGLSLTWNNPRKAFKEHAFKDDNVDLFFQTSTGDDNCIIRVLKTSAYGFESFEASDFMNKNDFLAYLGFTDGKCAMPFLEGQVSNKVYREFKAKYGVNLDRYQERALLSIEGSNLLLAVPGSGKTTVLVDRLGYMILCRGIKPEDILAITYNKHAAEEMKARFSQKFGVDIGERIAFKTLNALAYNIYLSAVSDLDQKRKHMTKRHKAHIISAFKNVNDRIPYESEIHDAEAAIAYIKNMCLSEGQISELNEVVPNIASIYNIYQGLLESCNEMDFDDQMVFAHRLLCEAPEILAKERSKYKYICVDEAQDSSKIQHEIIHMLANGKSIFMVGDEDQSIYGYRAAFPQALLNFRYDYRNPYIMRMEVNYRSTPEITDLAQRFISKNKGRYNKTMKAARPSGNPVELKRFRTRENQYDFILDVARTSASECAFLYRNNESALVLVDRLLREGIEFNLRKPEADVFGNRVSKDMLAYLSFSIDRNNIKALRQIRNKGILYLTKKQIDCAEESVRQGRSSLQEALEAQMKYNKRGADKERVSRFYEIINEISAKTTEEAIRSICESGYADYLEVNNLDGSKIDTLCMLAKEEPHIESFLERIKYIQEVLSKDITSSSGNQITLSTIHSSKGKEYDSAYLIDVYDGYFPSSKPFVYNRAKDNSSGEQEERRLFYVGLTRAKNNLTLCSLISDPSSYIEELFPEVSMIRDVEEAIESIGEIGLNSEKGISTARCLYNGLPDRLKKHISIAEFLDKAECEYASVVYEEEQKKKDAAERYILKVEEAIAGIGEVALEKEPLINHARDLYDGIVPDDYKIKVSNRERLFGSEEALKSLKESEKERKAKERKRLNSLRKCSICGKEESKDHFSTRSIDQRPICNSCALRGELSKEDIARLYYCPKCHTMLTRKGRELTCNSLNKCGWSMFWF